LRPDPDRPTPHPVGIVRELFAANGEKRFRGQPLLRVKEETFTIQVLTALRASTTALFARIGDYLIRRGSTGLDEGLVTEVRVDTLGRVGCSGRFFEARLITDSRFR
jgi:hypothetical protein